MNDKPHQPVLLGQVIELLSPQEGDRYLDLTAGYGGHAGAILDSSPKIEARLIDRDQDAISFLDKKFKNNQAVSIIKSDYLTALENLVKSNQKFEMILLDLGISSLQVDKAVRGFSFLKDGPLDMRMDQSQELTAWKVVNEYDSKSLIRILKEYGDEFRAERIVRAIQRARPLNSTTELRDAIEREVRRNPLMKKHPATKTFQAIRIYVNDEINQLEKALSLLVQVLNVGGRLAIISFHSLEDRIVKKFFNELSKNEYDATFKLVNKKALSGQIESELNPRARSAMLRAVVKIRD